MSLKMAHKVILPPKKNYIPQFLKQRDINSYYVPASYILYLSDFCRFLLCTCGWERRGEGECWNRGGG
jgi:hypothetical protein